MESYKKKLINKFWEERRLLHPHLSLLYDLTRELVRTTPMKQGKEDYQEWISRLFTIQVGGTWSGEEKIHTIPVTVYELDTLYHRNIHEPLDTDIETEHGIFRVIEMDTAIKLWIGEVSEILTDVARTYYIDIQFSNMIEQEDETMETL